MRGRAALVGVLIAFVACAPLSAQRPRGIRVPPTVVVPPGSPDQGVLELSTSTDTRTLPTTGTIPSYGPSRCFTLPSPYNNVTCRVSDGPTYCPGGDCVNGDHYSDWAQVNAHDGQATINVFMSYQDAASTRVGPVIMAVNKTTAISDPANAVTYRGRLTGSGTYAASRTSGWFWSHTNPNILYGYGEDSTIQAFDCTSVPCTPSTVLDLVTYAAEWGGDTTNIEAKSVKSSNDHLHWVMTVMDTVTAEKGCLYVKLGAGAKSEFVPWDGVAPDSTETGGDCAMSRDGAYVTTAYLGTGESNDTGVWRTSDWVFILDWSDQSGATGHSDSGPDHIVSMDNYGVADDTRLWNYASAFFTNAPCTTGCTPAAGQGLQVYRAPVDGSTYAQPSTISLVPVGTTPIADQVFAMTSTDTPTPSAGTHPREREIVVSSLDGTLRVATCSATLTLITATGGDIEYYKAPKGNVDPYMDWYFWNSNAGGAYLEAFVSYIKPCADRLIALLAPAPVSVVSGLQPIVVGPARPEPRYNLAARS